MGKKDVTDVTSVRISRETLKLLYKCRNTIAKKHGIYLPIGKTVRYLAVWYIKLQQEEKQKEAKRKKVATEVKKTETTQEQKVEAKEEKSGENEQT